MASQLAFAVVGLLMVAGGSVFTDPSTQTDFVDNAPPEQGMAAQEPAHSQDAALQCTDGEGLWTFPNGFTFGGPEDNSQESPYKEWVEACGFEVTYSVETVTVTTAEAVADYEACLAASAEAAAASTAAGEPWVPPVSIEGSDWHCGSPPAPPTNPEGTYSVDLPAVHIGSKHGSIQFTAYSYEAKNTNDQAGAINVIYWGNGQVAQAKNLLYTSSHWKDTEHHGFQCGSDRYAYVWDAMHTGGTDKWFTSNVQSEAHHSNDGWYHCNNAREHIRHYGDTTLTDSHSPSWSKYSIANVHHDDHDHDNPNSEDGKVHLTSDMSAMGYSYGQIWNSQAGIYIRTWQI